MCAECGTAEPLSAGAEKPSAPAREEHSFHDDGAGPGGVADFDLESGGFDDSTAPEAELDADETLERLVPETGQGRRCPKCANLLPEHAENCTRCGLSLAEAADYAPGEAPWERPPAGKADAQRHAGTLWQDVEETPNAENLERFVSYVRDEGLFEYGIRRLRFYLVEHPDDEAVVQALADLASGMESRLVASRARAETDAEEFQEDLSRMKRILVMVVAALWVIGAILVIQIFVGGGC